MSRIQRATRWIKYRTAPKALILMYHRVTTLPNDPHLLCVSPQNFAGHMEEIRARSKPVRLGQLAAALEQGEVPNRAVAITFDDGYADNLYHARPVLERLWFPATVFVTAGQVGSGRELWWDELDRLLLQPGALPARLQLSIGGREYHWKLGDSAYYSTEEFQRQAGWHIERSDFPTARQRIFLELFHHLLSLGGEQRWEVLEALRQWAGAGTSARPTHAVMNHEELRALAQAGLVSVGAHSMTHPTLSELSGAAQKHEILESKRCLEEILRRPVTTFAYPSGARTPEAMAALREGGFRCACSSEADAVWPGADPFNLPRLGVRNWDRPTFARWLDWWLDG